MNKGKWLKPYIGPFNKTDADGIAASLKKAEPGPVEVKVVKREGTVNYYDVMIKYS